MFNLDLRNLSIVKQKMQIIKKKNKNVYLFLFCNLFKKKNVNFKLLQYSTCQSQHFFKTRYKDKYRSKTGPNSLYFSKNHYKLLLVRIFFLINFVVSSVSIQYNSQHL